MLSRRSTLIALAAVLVAVVAVVAAIIYGLKSTGTPSGAVTDPTDVAAQYAKYAETKHPERGKADPQRPAPCYRSRRKPTTFDGFLIFVCFSPQPKSSPGTSNNPPECAVSTDHGVVTPEDGKDNWPSWCTKLPTLVP